MAKFFKTHYAPNNAVLVLCGDMDIPEAKKLVETYFGDIPAQEQPKTPDLSEPLQTGPRSEVYHDALANVPAVVIGYPGPVRRSPDYNALVMLDLLLTGGDSSRFQQNLVKGKKSVIQYEANLGWPFAGPSDYKDPGIYGIYLLYNPAFTGQQIVRQVDDEIAKIQQDGIADEELNRVRAYLRSTRIRELQSSRSRAALLGRYELLDGNPKYINTELGEFLAVTPGQMQAAAKKYLVPQKQTVLDIVPAPPVKNGKDGAPNE